MAKLKQANQKHHRGKTALAYVPRSVKKDWMQMLGVLPTCNGTQPLQPFRSKRWSRPAMTDACGIAGGFVHPTLTFSRKFASRERKAIIAVKETKMVAECIDQLAVSCAGTVLPIYVDNTVCLACCLKGSVGTARTGVL